ncbi:hypothetical protein TNCV_4991951 [Trichonephila clavipes]|nr:hypothetical protein TNCV_4991951 [Trichonephila clavipes]
MLMTFVPLGLDLNPVEGMNVSGPQSPQTTSPIVRLMERGERWDPPSPPQCVLHENWGETEPNHTITSMLIKAMANHRRTIHSFVMMNFMGLNLTLLIRWH